MNKKLLLSTLFTILLLISNFSTTQSKKIDSQYQQEEIYEQENENQQRINLIQKIQEQLEHIPELQKSFQILETLMREEFGQQQEEEEQSYFVNKPSIVKCQACKTAVGQLYNWDKVELKIGHFVATLGTYLCFQQWKWFPMNVCEGFSEEQFPQVVDALWEHYFNPNFICPLVTLCAKTHQKVDIPQLTAEIRQGKPQHPQLVPTLKKTLKVMQLADVHTDFEYETGSAARCTEPSCCRINSEAKINPDTGKVFPDTCGKWGNTGFNDIPVRTFNKYAEFVSKHVNLDFGFWTGDNTSHNIWAQNKEQNLANTIECTKTLKETNPDLTIYPMFGNHEAFPCNLYDFDGDNEKYLTATLSDIWSDWIGEKAAEMLKENGYYETVVEEYNLKLIALNTQAGDQANFLLFQNPTDPNNMLQKLRKSLQESEDNGNQPVWIFCHIPTSSDTKQIWSEVYAAIVDRYSYIIRGQFAGHTHHDQIQIFYDEDGKTINNVQYVAPSLTSYHKQNSSFRVYEVDSETLQVVNYKQYRMDINYWNQYTDDNTELIWEVAYDFQSEYNMKQLYDYNTFSQFRTDVGSNLSVYNKYMTNYWAGNYEPTSEIDQEFQCRMGTSVRSHQECLGKTYKPTIFDTLSGPWIEKIPKNQN